MSTSEPVQGLHLQLWAMYIQFLLITFLCLLKSSALNRNFDEFSLWHVICKVKPYYEMNQGQNSIFYFSDISANPLELFTKTPKFSLV